MVSEISNRVSLDRLRADIEANAEFGKHPEIDGHGRTVLPCSEANRKARERFVDRLRAAGLDVDVDAVGNIVGRWVPPTASEGAAAVATGSHLDSVPRGGIFDGPLGVYGALEAVRAIQEADVEPMRPFEVVCFTEEEGHWFSDGILGSSVAAGMTDIETAHEITNGDGQRLETALDNIGFLGTGRVEASTWHSWVELHVEQGTRLKNAGIPVGIVTDIVGTTRCHIKINGTSAHAGTTPMNDRCDALAAASELTLHLESVAEEMAQDGVAVGTVGHMNVEPNAVNVIPGSVSLRLDIRDVSYANIETIVTAVEQKLEELERERGVTTSFNRPYDVQPTELSPKCRDALETGAQQAAVDTMQMHSGAGHDTMAVAKATDAGLLFAPSEEGISHNPMEWTEWEDCATAVEVLAEGIASLATDTEISKAND